MNSTGAIERQAVGRHATLGALYDIRTDTLEGTNLFNKELPPSLIKTTDNAHLSYELDFNNSQTETFNKFNIEGELKLSLLSGLANIGGSAKFLKQTKTDGHTVRVTFICKVKTKQENLQISMADLHQYFSPDPLENPNATHVVTGIMWGANVAATFERVVQNREKVKEIEGKLSVALKGLPVSGEAGVKYENKNNSELESLQISFSGDLLDEACSRTIEGVMEVFEKIPSLIKPLNDGKGQQLVFVLYPLKRMAQIFKHELQIDRLIQEVSDFLVIRVENIFDEISTGKRIFNDFLNEIKAWEDYISRDWRKSIQKKQMEITAAELKTRRQLSTVLKNIRGGLVEESEMEKLLDNFESENSCSLTSIDQFLREKRNIKLKIQTLSEFDRETNLLKELTSIVGKISQLYDKKVYLLHISHEWATEDEQNWFKQFQFFKHLMNTETTHSEQNSDKGTIETAFLVIDYDLHHADLERDRDRAERCCIYYAKDGRIESKDYYDYSQKTIPQAVVIEETPYVPQAVVIEETPYVPQAVVIEETPYVPKADSAQNEKPDDKNMLKLIINEIINVLDLEENEKKDDILKDLLENGQQSLKNYQEYLTPDIYAEITNEDNNELTKHLKNYFEQHWKIKYTCSNEWFIQFLNQSKCNGSNHSYEQTLIRTAKHGNKYMKNCPILSITLQILFEDITDQHSNETDIFDELWLTITTHGLKSIIKYSDYIAKVVINEQINKGQSILFQALRESYREKLFQLLQQCNINDRQNLYESALDNVAELGWKIGLEAIEMRVIPKNYIRLLEKVDSYLQQQQQEYDEVRKQSNLFDFIRK